MKTDTKTLLAELEQIARANLQSITDLKQKTVPELNSKPGPSAWSILECLEHLNRYSAFYLPEIKKNMRSGNASLTFKSGLIGTYHVNMVKLKPAGKKMKTFAAMDPAGSTLTPDVIDTFLESQRHLLELIEQAHHSNLNTPCIPVTFTRLIRLKPGDALRFMVYHNQRHVAQALGKQDE